MAGKINAVNDLICKLEPVKDTLSCNIVCSCPETGPEILVASGAHSEIDILSSDKKFNQLIFPSDVTGLVIREDDEGTLKLWSSTNDGTVYFIPDVERVASRQHHHMSEGDFLSFCLITTKFPKSIKNTMSCSMYICNLICFRESDEKGNESGEDIFDDLAAPQCTKAPTTNKVDASEWSVVKSANNVLCLHMIHDLVLLLSAVENAGYMLSWYSSGKLETHVNKAERLQNHKNLGEVYLPNHSLVDTKDNAYFRSPVLCCVSVEDKPIDGCSLPAKCINKYLYNDLFGVNNNLLDAEVVLVGLPNGHVYATSLKTCQQTPKLIYDLGEPVVGIFTVKFKEELSELEEVMGHNSTKTSCNCLLVIGGNGKIACIFRGENKKEPVYKEVFVPSQVVCSGYAQCTLLLATSTELQMVHVEEIQKANKYQYLQCRGLNMFNVRAMCTTPVEVGTRLYALCKRGQILHKQVNFANLESLPTGKENVGSDNLKDLLTGIGYISDELNQARKEVNQVNSVLEQLAIASAMATYAYSESTHKRDNSFPIYTKTSVRQVDLGSTIKFVLVIDLTNSGLVSLGDNWSIIVNINSDTDLGPCSQESGEKMHTLNTVIAQTCHPSLCSLNGFQQIQHDLPADILSKLPFSVTVSLSYDITTALPSKVPHEEQMRTKTMSKEDSTRPHCVTVPFHRSTIDILNLVKPATTHTSLVPRNMEAATSIVHSGVESALVQLAQKRPTAWKLKERLSPSGADGKNQYSTSVRLAGSTAKQLLGKRDATEVKILQSLLPTVAESKIKQAMVRLVTVDGHLMVLSVVKATAEQRQSNCFDIHVQCPTVFLLCQLRSAIHSRVKIFNTEDDFGCTSKEARIILQQIKSIQSEVQHLQDAASDNNLSSDQLAMQTVQLWLRLRNIKYPM